MSYLSANSAAAATAETMEGRCEIATAVTPSALYIRPLIEDQCWICQTCVEVETRDRFSNSVYFPISSTLHTSGNFFMGFGEFSRQTDPISFVAFIDFCQFCKMPTAKNLMKSILYNYFNIVESVLQHYN